MVFTLKTFLLLLPLLLINIVLIIICLKDWLKRKTFQYLPKYAWLAIFLCLQFIGPTCYLLLGRKDEYNNDSESE